MVDTYLQEHVKTYKDFADMLGDMVLCNEMASRPLALVSGCYDEGDEVFQWFIVSRPDFAMRHTDELVFYDEELDLYVLGVTHWGTSWDYVPAPEMR